MLFVLSIAAVILRVLAEFAVIVQAVLGVVLDGWLVPPVVSVLLLFVRGPDGAVLSLKFDSVPHRLCIEGKDKGLTMTRLFKVMRNQKR